MSKTVPGTCALHAIVTDACRANRTDRGAGEEAVRRLVDEYMQCLNQPTGTQFHFVLTVERSNREPTS